MADAKTPKDAVVKFVYPFQATDASDPSAPKTTEATDPNIFYEALAKAQDGFYPIGANGLWHGGVHFGAETGGALAQDKGVRCIADGEVIAYRIDDTYPTVDFPQGGPARFSTGFVLVAHRLELPKAPAGDAAAGQSANQGAAAEEPSLTFYSLYMHLKDWAGYKADTKLKRPTYWVEEFIVGEKPDDTEPTLAPGITGLRVRNAENTAIAMLPHGTRLRLGAVNPARRGFHAIASITEGDSVPPGVQGGYAYRSELTAYGTPQTLGDVVLLDPPVPVMAGDLIGHLGEFQRFADLNPMGKSGNAARPLLQIDVFTTDDLPGFIAKGKARAAQLDAKQRTLLKVDSGAVLVLPAAGDVTVSDSEHLQADSDSPKQGHWAKVRRVTITAAPTAKDANAVRRTPAGTAFWVERAALDKDGRRAAGATLTGWSAFPLRAAAGGGPTAGYTRVAPIKTLKQMAIEADGTRWWQVDVGTSGKDSGTGWAREKDHAGVTLCSPWEWPGFELLDVDQTTPASFYANQMVRQGHDLGKEEGAIAAQGANADNSLVFRKLFDVIDADGDKAVVAEELQQALRKPWLAQAIASLVARYRSEWSGPMSRWDEIDTLIDQKNRANWTVQKQRIEKLLWWDKVSAGGKGPAGEPVVRTLHPVALVSNFQRSGLRCRKCGTTISITPAFMRTIAGSGATDAFINEFCELYEALFIKYEMDTCNQIKHFMGQGKHESKRFTSFRESLYYSSYTAQSLYRMAPTVINQGFDRRGLTFATNEEKMTWITDNLLKNDAGYGKHAFGNNAYPDNDYRGRGWLHLTHYDAYRRYTAEVGDTIDAHPELVETDTRIILETGLWFWKGNNIGAIADAGPVTNERVTLVTKPINTGLKGLDERKTFTLAIATAFENEFGKCTD